jgi:integrase
MFEWLTRVRYIQRNPWSELEPFSDRTGKAEQGRLSERQRALLEEWLSLLPATAAADRLRLMFRLMLFEGLRSLDLAGLRWGDLQEWQQRTDGPLPARLMLRRGVRATRVVILSPQSARELVRHVEQKGQGNDLAKLPPDLPLISSLDQPTRPMTAARAHELVKAALCACANVVRRRDPHEAERIRRASPSRMTLATDPGP